MKHRDKDNDLIPKSRFEPQQSTSAGQAFLKASVRYEEASMAHLVDGRAVDFAAEFEDAFCTTANQIVGHNDFPLLNVEDGNFILSFHAIMIIQNACSFNRRVVLPVLSFPNLLLGMAKVRFDMPCSRRRSIAQEFLAAQEGGDLDISSLKIWAVYNSDINQASVSGKIGVGFYVALKALRKVWLSDSRENERLNKALKLFGQRAPNSSLDLISSRLTLKYNLGAAISSHDEGGHAPSKTWKNMKPLAGQTFSKILDHWFDATKVMNPESRFGGVSSCKAESEWCPTAEEVQKWMPLLDPLTQRVFPKVKQSQKVSKVKVSSTSSALEKKPTTHHIIAATVNRKLFDFWKDNKDATCQFAQPHFTAMAMVENTKASFKPGRPYRLEENTEVFILGETVNRSVRVLPGVWKENRVVLLRPWQFRWAGDFFLEKLQTMEAACTIIAFPISWMTSSSSMTTTSNNDAATLAGFILSKDGTKRLLTIPQWQEEAWFVQNHHCRPSVLCFVFLNT